MREYNGVYNFKIIVASQANNIYKDNNSQTKILYLIAMLTLSLSSNVSKNISSIMIHV
jgi:hypothetical protein